MKLKNNDSEETNSKIEFPYFLLGFIAMIILDSYVLGPVISIPNYFMEFVSVLTTWLLTAAMVGLGLNVSLRDLRERAMLPLAAMTIVSVALSVLTYFII